MPGLIQNQIDPANPNVVSGAATQNWDATTRTVNPDTETTAGQLNKLLTSGNPYIESAKSAASDFSNSRGLLNSSMAATAGEKAAIDSAIPIAQSDAGVYGTAATQNQQAQNAAGQFNAGAVNTSNQATANAANTATQQATTGTQQQQAIASTGTQQRQTQTEAGQIQSGLQTQQGNIASGLSAQQATQTQETQRQGAEQQTGLQDLKGTQAQALADTEAAYKNLLQTSASATAIFNQVSQNINTILNNPDTDAATKQSLLANQQQILQSGLAIAGGIGNVDLTDLLTFNTPV